MTASIDQIATLVLPSKDDATLAVGAQALELRNIETLSPGRAIEGLTLASDSADARATLTAASIAGDVCVQLSQGRRRTVLVCDMDSTLIGQECIDELADFAGVKERVSEITERAMRGEIGFEGALEERVGLLEGLDVSTLQRCFEDRIRPESRRSNAGSDHERKRCQDTDRIGRLYLLYGAGRKGLWVYRTSGQYIDRSERIADG